VILVTYGQGHVVFDFSLFGIVLILPDCLVVQWVSFTDVIHTSMHVCNHRFVCWINL
jgi:hypothetical protein